MGYGGDLKVIKDEIHKELGRWVSRFISDEHRKFIIRCHAQGMPSSAAVWELMVKDKIINRLAQKDALGAEELRKMLIQRLAYLKPGQRDGLKRSLVQFGVKRGISIGVS